MRYCMLIWTVVLLSLQHKLEQKYASAKKRKQNKNTSIQDIIEVWQHKRL